MRHFILILIVSILMAGCETSADPVEEGPVAMITRYNSSGEKTRMERYARNGDLQEEISYYNDGTVDNRITYKYGDNGYLLEKYDSSMSDKYIYTYDHEGRRVSEVNEDLTGRFETRSFYLEEGRLQIDSSDRHDYVTWKYLDDKGNIVTWLRFDVEGDTIGHTETTYNEKGNELEYIAWDYGQFFNHKKYVYDTAGNQIEEQILDEHGNIEKRYVNTYDAENRLSKIEQVDADGNSTFTITYTHKGNARICDSAIPGMKTRTTKEVYTYHSKEE